MTDALPAGTTMSLDGGPPIPLDEAVLRKHIEDKLRPGRPPMKADKEFDGQNADAYAVTAEELRQFIERYEQLEAEKKDVADQQKEVMAEAKGRGYDTKALRKIVALRKLKPDDLAEQEAVLDVYKIALGMA
jgi:uncharacterized protein (UPF0335 family)